MRVDRVVRQEPLADALELLTPPTGIGVKPAQKLTECRHDNWILFLTERVLVGG